jgi:outer membrane protein W
MKTLQLLVMTLTLSAAALAQSGVYTGFTWNMGFPGSTMGEYIDKTSFRGFGLTIAKYVQPDLSIGGSISWNIFDELLRGRTETIENGAVTGTQVRYINSLPLMINARHFWGERRGEVHPFIGLNAGVYYIRQRLDIGVWSIENDNWHVGLAPEFGLYIPVSRETFLTATARWNYAFDAGTRLGGDPDNSYSYWGIDLGIGSIQGWF